MSARLPDWAMPRGKNRCQLHLLFLSGCYRPAFICFGAAFSQWMMLLFFLCSWLFLCIFRAFGILQHLLRAISCLKTLQAAHPASGSVPQTALQVPSQPLFHQPVPHFSRHSPRFHRLSCSRVLSVLHHAGCFLCPLPPTQ